MLKSPARYGGKTCKANVIEDIQEMLSQEEGTEQISSVEAKHGKAFLSLV